MGLLDALNSDEGRFGLGLLSMAGPQAQPMGAGQRIAGAMQFMEAGKDRQAKAEAARMQQQLMQAQLANYQSEIDNRSLAAKKDARQQELIASFLNGGGTSGGGAGFVQPGEGQAQQGGLPTSPGGILALAQRFGIPPQAVQADMAFNGGKSISEMLAKHGSRDMQVTNGYAYDKNNLGAGFMPSIQTSQDGKSTMTRIGPDGLPIVSAPQGALETFRGYQGAQADYKPIKVFNPATGREEYRSEGQVVGGASTPPAPLRTQTQPGVTGAGYAGGDRDQANRESILIMQSEMSRAKDPADKAAIGREIMRLQQQSGFPQGTPMQPQSGAYAAGPSMMEQAAGKAAETRAVNTAAADVVRDTGLKTDAKRSGQFAQTIDRAVDLLNQGPTSSLVGIGVDKLLGAGGMATKGADVGAQLGALSGWLTSNVPRMEGPQSDRDAANYATMAGMVGDNSQPISKRLAAAKEVKNLQMKYASLNGIDVPGQSGGSASQQTAAPRMVFDSKPPANASNKGKLLVSPDGKRFRSNGMQWTEE